MASPDLKNLQDGKKSAWVVYVLTGCLTEDFCLEEQHTTCGAVGLEMPVVRQRPNAESFLR